MSLPEVVTVGEAMVLLYSADGSTPLGKVRQLTMDVGGADSNFAIAMTRLGFSAGWVSRVGAGPLGEFVVQTIADEGVDVSRVASDRDHPTGVYFKYHVPTTRPGSSITGAPRPPAIYGRRTSIPATLLKPGCST